MEPTQICMVRHGETAWNNERRIQGHIDIELAVSGMQQARAAGRYFRGKPVKALYSSDLLRARQTAECIGMSLGLTPMLVAEFRERRYGSFEGLTYADARSSYPDEYAAFEQRDPVRPLPGGGESLRDFHSRVTARLQQLAQAHAGETIVVVTHGGVLDIVNRFVRGNPLDIPRDFQIPNAGVNWLELRGDQWSLISWGETDHLHAAALDELP